MGRSTVGSVHHVNTISHVFLSVKDKNAKKRNYFKHLNESNRAPSALLQGPPHYDMAVVRATFFAYDRIVAFAVVGHLRSPWRFPRPLVLTKRKRAATESDPFRNRT
jgi:hypothetical protein